MAFQGDSIFWVDTEKVVPNPFQPRREFDQSKLQELSESIRMYGVLQPLTVTRTEVQRDDGTFYTEYELIAGERRLRASRLAGVAQVPVIIREGEQNEQEKLELAIIENLQREDLNAVDRALAFQQLAEQFELSHTQVAQKVGRSREYVSNSIRLLDLPDHIKLALQRGELGEGHARTLLMLNDKPQEQETIFREILLKKMSVREVERIVRKIAIDKVRKKQHSDIGDHLIDIEKEFTETLGTRVQIQKTEFGGKLTIDYFSEDDLSSILKRMQAESGGTQTAAAAASMAAVAAATPLVSAQGEDAVEIAQSPEYQAPQNQQPKHAEQNMAAADPVQPYTQSEPPEAPAEPVEPKLYHQSESATAESVVPEPSTPETYPQSEPATPVQSEPVAHSTAPVAAEQQPSTPPAADPSLLERLAAHTSFGFSRPEPVAEQPVAPPEPTPTNTPEPETVAPVYPVSDEYKKPDSPQVEPQPPVASSAPEPEEPKDESEDIYSIRNFSI
jgi:ParB family chromosome partitioning protein